MNAAEKRHNDTSYFLNILRQSRQKITSIKRKNDRMREMTEKNEKNIAKDVIFV